MTREEKQKAIDALKISAPVSVVTQEEFNDYIKTLNKIMDWLEQEPCEDAISRQAILDEINRVGIKAFKTYNDYSQLFDFVDTLPPVKPQERTGYWIYIPKRRLVDETDEGGVYITDYKCTCSECGGDFGFQKMSDAYCKYCGARMEGEQYG